MTQAHRLIVAIRSSGRVGMTALELEQLGISQCPWKRLSESGHRWLSKGERLVSRVGRDGLKRRVITRA
jgi:hypothetical protein